MGEYSSKKLPSKRKAHKATTVGNLHLVNSSKFLGGITLNRCLSGGLSQSDPAISSSEEAPNGNHPQVE